MFKRKDIGHYLKEGHTHLRKGELLKAKESYINGLSIDPANITILNNLSQIHKIFHEEKKAMGYSEILLEECNRRLDWEKTEQVLLLKSNALITLGREDEAMEVFDEILKINPKNMVVLFQKAQYLEVRGEYEEAVGCLDVILGDEEYNISALLSKGRNLTSLSRFADAEKHINLVFKIDPKNMAAMNLKAKLIKKKNNSTISPHDFMLRAMNAWEMEEFKESLAYFDKAIDLDSGYDEIWYVRGELLIRMGQLSDAIDSFRKAFEINPESGGIKKKREFFMLLNGMRRLNIILGFERQRGKF